MSARLLICIPVHNRINIVRECIPTVQDGMIAGHDSLAIYDDGSTESYNLGYRGPKDIFNRCRESIGIEAQRRMHFMDFARSERDYTHLYLADSDALHDPRWRERALKLQSDHGGAPVCLYNTDAHVRLEGNTIEDDPKSDVIWRRVAPGISYLLTAEHVAKVVQALPHLPEHWSWDWTVPAILGHRFAISRTSYVDHLGYGGYHHPVGAGFDEGDRALHPTSWLVSKRAEVVAKLKHATQP